MTATTCALSYWAYPPTHFGAPPHESQAPKSTQESYAIRRVEVMRLHQFGKNYPRWQGGTEGYQ